MIVARRKAAARQLLRLVEECESLANSIVDHGSYGYEIWVEAWKSVSFQIEAPANVLQVHKPVHYQRMSMEFAKEEFDPPRQFGIDISLWFQFPHPDSSHIGVGLLRREDIDAVAAGWGELNVRRFLQMCSNGDSQTESIFDLCGQLAMSTLAVQPIEWEHVQWDRDFIGNNYGESILSAIDNYQFLPNDLPPKAVYKTIGDYAVRIISTESGTLEERAIALRRFCECLHRHAAEKRRKISHIEGLADILRRDFEVKCHLILERWRTYLENICEESELGEPIGVANSDDVVMSKLLAAFTNGASTQSFRDACAIIASDKTVAEKLEEINAILPLRNVPTRQLAEILNCSPAAIWEFEGVSGRDVRGTTPNESEQNHSYPLPRITRIEERLLIALFELESKDAPPAPWRNQETIVERAFGKAVDYNIYKINFSKLSSNGFLESKRGNAGGHRLTELGKDFAKKATTEGNGKH